MRYTITGAAGHIAGSLVQELLDDNQQVTVIGRNPEHLDDLVRFGAQTLIGSLEDAGFVKKAFAGADAVFTMCPPIVNDDLLGYCERIGKNYMESIAENNIRYVVNLSSIGAHLEKGAGHITGLNRVEQLLNNLDNINIKHLRPVFFYTNLFAQFELIHNAGIMGANFRIRDKFPIVDPADIAAVAAHELLNLDFSGYSTRYIASDERSTDDIAAVIGDAIGKPGLRWIKFTDEQALEGLIQAGFPDKTAREFVEGFRSMHEGSLLEDYWKHRPQVSGTRLEKFAGEFAAAWRQKYLDAAPKLTS